jgi:hypothetical protein
MLLLLLLLLLQAIDAGLEAFAAKQFSEAIDLFNLALELPGNGEACFVFRCRSTSCFF